MRVFTLGDVWWQSLMTVFNGNAFFEGTLRGRFREQVLCHIYPLQKPALRVHRLVPKRPNSSRNRAQHAFPAQRPECLTLRTLMPHLPLAETSFESPSAGSETAEQQQESCPTCLPSAAPQMSNVAYWYPKKTSLMPHLYPLQKPALRVHRLVPKRPNTSRNRAQHAFPAQRPECLTSRTDYFGFSWQLWTYKWR